MTVGGLSGEEQAPLSRRLRGVWPEIEMERAPIVRLNHLPVLDALRGVAIMLVIGFHAHSFIPGGALGVDLFFVLSGFLITSLLLTEFSRTRTVSLSSFYVRRARRLLPALVLFILGTLGLLVLIASTGATQVDSRQLHAALYGLLYVSNFMRALHPQPLEFSHLWSLATEEQFYFVWPPILVFLIGRRVRPRRLAAGLGVAAALSTAYAVTLAIVTNYSDWSYFAPDARANALLLGCFGGVVYSFAFVRRVPTWLVLLAIAPAVVPLVAGYTTLGTTGAAVFEVASLVVVLHLVTQPTSRFARLVDRKTLRGLGKISYALYLWNSPLFVLFGWQRGLPLALVISLLSYRYVERPFLRRKRTDSEVDPTERSTPAALPVAAATAVIDG